MDEVADRYGLGDYLDCLCVQWGRPDSPGLRPFTASFNKAIIGVRLTRADEAPLEATVEGLYDHLTADDVAPYGHSRAKRKLREHGIDPNILRVEMPSYKTFERHAKDCEGIEAPEETRSKREATATARDQIRALEGYIDQVIEGTLDTLVHNDHVALDGYEPVVSLGIRCSACGSEHSVRQAIEAGCPTCSGTERRHLEVHR
jgi:hypothetical protein